ncbi:MAG: hypothetical protein PHF76_11590 [Bacteroidales bacterium]|nr:hypothetical protein [Bacteroidales bacterium]
MFKSFFKTALIAGLMVAMVQGTYAQKTADELKAERQELQTELKAKKTVKRAEKLDKLAEQGMPTASNVSSVDALATSSAALLVTTKANNDFLSKFKRTVTDNGGGEVDVTTEKAKLNDYAQLAVALGVSIASVAAETQKVQAIKDEIKSLSPAQAMPATKSVKFSTDALDVCAGELQLQLKLVNNLIETIKSSGNY